MSENETPPPGRELTGRKALMIFVAFFGLVISVNLYMAYQAVSTFPGLEVSSSYADSQDFNIRRDAQEALGWTATVSVDVEAGVLTLGLVDRDGLLVVPVEFQALLTRPTNQTEDQMLDLTRGTVAYTAPVDISPGRWRLRLTGIARDGTDYRHNITFTLPN
jgi:nitrogen fixation protein FixH